MNLSKPIHLITVGSLSLSALVLITLLIAQYLSQSDFGLLTIMITPLITFLAAFGVFYFLIERFISAKMKNIYRIISSQKLAVEKRSEFSIKDNPLDQLTAQAVLATRVILPAAPSYRKPAQRSRDGVSRGLDIRKPAMQHRSSVDSQATYLPCMISRHTILQGVENC